MIEVLWHGRGGQGAFTAARLLGAAAAMAEGSYALAFPSFGPERRGAPMRAFTKMDNKPIGDRSAIVRADYVVYLDDTLLDTTQRVWEDELKPESYVLVNSTRKHTDPRIMSLDANGISERILGRPIPNTVFLGALAVLCSGVEEEDVIDAVRQYMPARLHAKNEKIIEEAVCQTRRLLDSSSGVSKGFPHAIEEPSAENVSRETSRDALVGGDDDVVRTCAHIPALRRHMTDPPSLVASSYARTTCYRAGHLVAKNAGWRNERPVIDAALCTGCLQCYLYCPDGTVYKTHESKGRGDVGESSSVRSAASSAASPAELSAVPSAASPVEPPVTLRNTSSAETSAALPVELSAETLRGAPIAVDYDFCKGCGICARMCKFDAIAMVPESEARRS